MGIMQCCFSPDGIKLAASAMDDKHTIGVWDWEAGKTIATGPGTRGNILSLEFNNDSTTIVACAVKEVGFCTFAGGKLIKKTGTGMRPPTSVLCSAYDAQGTLYTGMFSGKIAVWSGNAVTKELPAHTARCNSLFFSNGQLISGGNDGVVITWTAASGTLTEVSRIDLKNPTIRSNRPMATSVYK
jgi:WD40 repeat protein